MSTEYERSSGSTPEGEAKRISLLKIQPLFATAVVLKVGLALLGWVFDQPIWLGTVGPMAVMVAYILLGHYRREPGVSVEKFADSCYYLGFIFTVVSIILCLIDVPKLNQEGALRDIALRFGVAMASTVLGMFVRVLLVGFRKDMEDAVNDAEEALVHAARALKIELDVTLGSLRAFQGQVVDATNQTMDHMRAQTERMSQEFSATLKAHFEATTRNNQDVLKAMLDEVKGGSGKLVEAMGAYSSGLEGHIRSVQSTVTSFADAVVQRLHSTEFPDDFFVRKLSPAIDALSMQVAAVGGGVGKISTSVNSAGSKLELSLNALHERTSAASHVADRVVEMGVQHERIFEASERQLSLLHDLAQKLGQIDVALRSSLNSIGSNTSASADLIQQVRALSVTTADLASKVSSALDRVSTGLHQQSAESAEALTKVGTNSGELGGAVRDMVSTLREQTRATAGLMAQIERVLEVLQSANLRARSSPAVSPAVPARPLARPPHQPGDHVIHTAPPSPIPSPSAIPSSLPPAKLSAPGPMARSAHSAPIEPTLRDGPSSPGTGAPSNLPTGDGEARG